MTALDQAFIKAFSQQGASPIALVPQPAPVVADLRVSEPTIVVPTAPPTVAKKPATPKPISDIFRGVLETLEKSPASAPSAMVATKQKVPAKSIAQPLESVTSDSWSTGSWQSSFDMPACVGFAESICIAEPAVLPQIAEPQPTAIPAVTAPVTAVVPPSVAPIAAPTATVAPSIAAPVAPQIEPPIPTTPSHQPTVEPPCEPGVAAVELATLAASVPPVAAPPASATKPAVEHDFQPAWQVDRFTWPRVCRRLMGKASTEFDRLADALMSANIRGQRVLAVAACHRGEGATTLLLCVARRLAERGVRLVLVDADLSRPRIAKRLGVQPQIGWNETCEAEGTPLSHAVVEATSNGLAIATVNDPLSPTGHTTGDWGLLASCLDTLKENYEMVLVDLGPLENIESPGDALGRVVNGKIDGLLLVHNGRVTSTERLGDVQQALTTSGIPLAGMIENFVAA